MNKNPLYVLLEIVKNDSDLRRLIHEGVDYKQIGTLTNQAFEQGLLVFNNEKIELTGKGAKLLKEHKSEFERINKNLWIMPDIKNRVAKIEKNDIFLPGQDELTFL